MVSVKWQVFAAEGRCYALEACGALAGGSALPAQMPETLSDSCLYLRCGWVGINCQLKVWMV